MPDSQTATLADNVQVAVGDLMFDFRTASRPDGPQVRRFTIVAIQDGRPSRNGITFDNPQVYFSSWAGAHAALVTHLQRACTAKRRELEAAEAELESVRQMRPVKAV